jgi:hypothetical protein
MPDTTTITCPKCGEKIPLDDALTKEIDESNRKKMQERENTIRKEYEKKMKNERIILKQEAERKAREEAGAKFRDLELANAEKDQKLQEAGKREMDFIKQKRELEEKVKSVDLEVARKIEAERKKIEEGAQTKVSEEFRLQLKARDEKETQMSRTIDDLKRKLEQGSMQIQGEIQEDDLKEALSTAFPEDSIDDVPQGIRGADLVQTVQTRTGFQAGTMIWESKNTKAWGGDWAKKLKDDQVLVKADIAILVSQALPDGIKGFGLFEGVWVSDPTHFLPLAHALRHQLIQLAQMKSSLVGKDEKMEILYAYLTSPQFKNRMENIVGAFVSMKADLESEQRSAKRQWSKREKEIERVIDNTAGMYGDFQGLVGSALPTISSLELPSGEEAEDAEENNTASS